MSASTMLNIGFIFVTFMLFLFGHPVLTLLFDFEYWHKFNLIIRILAAIMVRTTISKHKTDLTDQ